MKKVKNLNLRIAESIERFIAAVQNPAHEIELYFGPADAESGYADYLTRIRKEQDRFSYLLEGHGIGSNHYNQEDIDALLARIQKDNALFNHSGLIAYIIRGIG